MPKLGFVTASMFNKCMTKSFGLVVQKQCARIACERLGVKWLDEQYDISQVYAIAWGSENESLAISAYEAQNFVEVHSRQKFGQIEGRFLGGTCDGLVGEDGGMDAKCPVSGNHLLNIVHGLQSEEYMYQFQAYMWIYKRDWWDLCSFDPRFPDDLQLYTKRINREDSVISQIDQRAKEMEDYISNLVEKARPGFVFKPE